MRTYYRVIEPEIGPNELPTSEDIALVWTNHGGNTSRPRGDSGITAEYLANEFGLLTLAYDRPVGRLWPQDRSFKAHLDTDGVEVMKPMAEKLAAAVSLEGIKKVIIIGCSGGGLGAMELANTRLLPTSRVYTLESVASHEHSSQDGLAYTRRYAAAQKPWLEQHPDPDEQINSHTSLSWPRRLQRLAFMGFDFARDVRYNRERWCRPLLLDLTRRLLEQPGPSMQHDFADHSFTAATDNPAIAGQSLKQFDTFNFKGAMDTILAPFYELARQQSDRLKVNILPNESHATTVDRRTVIAKNLWQIVGPEIVAA